MKLNIIECRAIQALRNKGYDATAIATAWDCILMQNSNVFAYAINCVQGEAGMHNQTPLTGTQEALINSYISTIEYEINPEAFPAF